MPDGHPWFVCVAVGTRVNHQFSIPYQYGAKAEHIVRRSGGGNLLGRYFAVGVHLHGTVIPQHQVIQHGICPVSFARCAVQHLPLADDVSHRVSPVRPVGIVVAVDGKHQLFALRQGFRVSLLSCKGRSPISHRAEGFTLRLEAYLGFKPYADGVRILIADNLNLERFGKICPQAAAPHSHK